MDVVDAISEVAIAFFSDRLVSLSILPDNLTSENTLLHALGFECLSELIPTFPTALHWDKRQLECSPRSPNLVSLDFF